MPVSSHKSQSSISPCSLLWRLLRPEALTLPPYVQLWIADGKAYSSLEYKKVGEQFCLLARTPSTIYRLSCSAFLHPTSPPGSKFLVAMNMPAQANVNGIQQVNPAPAQPPAIPGMLPEPVQQTHLTGKLPSNSHASLKLTAPSSQ